MAKKPNITKSLKKVTKSVSKATKPVATAVAKEVKPVATAVAKEVTPVATAVAKPVTKKPAAKKQNESEYKKKYEECEKASQIQRTEITNLKYRITAADNEKKDFVNQIKTNNDTITNLNNEIGALNKNVNIMDSRINAPLVEKKEGFSGIIEGFPKDPARVTPNDQYIDYDINRSGLKAVANEYKRLYGDYYAGYKDGETMNEILLMKNQYLSSTDLDGMEYSYGALKKQNKTLEAQIGETADEYSTDFQKAKYVESDVTSVKKRNAILFFLFYILYFFFVYSLFTGNSELSIPIKISIVLVTLFYPYWIAYLSQFTSFIFNYSIALFRGTPYEPSLK